MLSAERLERLRGYLLEQREILVRQIDSLTQASQQADVSMGNHMAEDATAAFDQATQVSLARGQQIQLEQVKRALERMQHGTYGSCTRCGDEIDFARLKAVPYATLCLNCQRAAEL